LASSRLAIRAAKALGSLRTVAEVSPRDDGAALVSAPEGEGLEGGSAARAGKTSRSAARPAEPETRSPKAESRSKSEIRRPKAEVIGDHEIHEIRERGWRGIIGIRNGR
jgi:hypothetical protein